MSGRKLWSICLALFLIAFSISTVTNIEVVPLVVGVLALIAGVLLLFDR